MCAKSHTSRTHQRVILAAEFGVIEIDQPQRPFAGPGQIEDQRFA
jgi:hypothetical protein